jgi:hypothetical protein
MKKKNLIIVITVLAVLAVVVAAAAFLNAENARQKKEQESSAYIVVKKGGVELADVDMDSIRSMGEVNFPANLDTSETGPVSHKYTGVPLIKVLDSLGVEIAGARTVIVRALDGYTVAFDVSEIEDKDNIYIAYKIDGQYLGNRSQGGSGPFQIIVRKDPYSQRWCKFVMEIDLE